MTQRTGNDTSTLRGGAQHDLGGAKDAVDAVGKRGRVGEGHADHVSLGVCDGFLHSHHDLLGRGASDAHTPLFVANHHHSTKAELLAALDYLGDALDLHNALRELLLASTTAAAIGEASADRECCWRRGWGGADPLLCSQCIARAQAAAGCKLLVQGGVCGIAAAHMLRRRVEQQHGAGFAMYTRVFLFTTQFESCAEQHSFDRWFDRATLRQSQTFACS